MTNQSIDITFSFNDILTVCACDRQWLLELIDEGVIAVEGNPEQALFSGFQMGRIRRAQRLSRDFEAGMPALGLIIRLLDELEDLRKQSAPLSLIKES